MLSLIAIQIRMQLVIKSKQAHLILLLILLGTALRIWFLMVNDSHSTDGIAYIATADYFHHTSDWPEVPKRIITPLYPFLVFLMSFLTGGNVDVAGRWINMLIGVLMIPTVFLIAKRFFNQNTGYFASLLIAVDPILIKHSSYDRADLIFALFTIVMAYYFRIIPWEEGNYRNSLLFGFILGISQLSRPNSVWFLFIFVTYWIIHIIKNRVFFWNFIIKTFLPVIVVFLILSSIPNIYLKIIKAPNQSYIGHAFIIGSFEAKGTKEHDWYQLNTDATDFIRNEKIRSFKITDIFNWEEIATKYVYGWNYIFNFTVISIWDYFQGWIALFFVILLFFFIMRKEIMGWNQVGYLTLFFIPFIIFLPLIQTQEIYLLPLRLISIIILGWLLANFASIEKLRTYGKTITATITIGIIATNLNNLYILRENEAAYINGYRIISHFLIENKKPGEAVMARNNSVYFYARMKGYPLPASPLNQVVKFCHNKNIKYFVFGPDERRIRSAWEKEILEKILNGDKTFELIHTEIHGERYYVFKVN